MTDSQREVYMLLLMSGRTGEAEEYRHQCENAGKLNKEVLAMEKISDGNKLYLAYGSNLNLEQMGYRCPYAVPLGSVELSGYRLLFRGSKNSAVATVEPDEGGIVPALLWEITPRDEEALDRYEGYPHFYRKEIVTVALNGKPVEAMVYLMNAGHPLGLPNDYYLNVILEGYASAGFDAITLEAAMAESVGGEKPGQQGDCLSCSNSMSEEASAENEADRLFCLVKQKYVDEDDSCDEYN